MSTDTAEVSSELVEQKDALKFYLDSLLLDIPQSQQPAENKNKPVVEMQIPKWAENGFSALKLYAAGMSFYVPISYVSGIKKVKQKFTASYDKPDWLLGSLVLKRKSVTVINTGKLVSQDLEKNNYPPHPDQNEYVILLGDGSYGLSCDSIAEVTQMAVKDIHWKMKNASQRWMLGTCVNEMAALLDARRIVYSMLMNKPLV